MDDLAEIERRMAPIISFDHLLQLRHHGAGVSTFYGEICAKHMKKILLLLGCNLSSRYLDIGCGGGRWLATAHALGIKQILGVEYVAERADVAHSVLGTRAKIWTGDVCSCDIWLERPTHVTFYDLAIPMEQIAPIYDKICSEMSIDAFATWKREVSFPNFERTSCVVKAWPSMQKYTAYIHRRRKTR